MDARNPEWQSRRRHRHGLDRAEWRSAKKRRQLRPSAEDFALDIRRKVAAFIAQQQRHQRGDRDPSE